MKLKPILFSIAGILGFSFLLNFLWESLHGYSLYLDHIIASDKYVRMMVYMSFMDAITILAMYLVCAFFIKDILWLNNMNHKRVSIFFILGLFVAVAAEYWAVYVTHEWLYNENMPVILGIGLSPLVQLSLTGGLAIWLTQRISYGGENAL
jgi:hypothetical protein